MPCRQSKLREAVQLVYVTATLDVYLCHQQLYDDELEASQILNESRDEGVYREHTWARTDATKVGR